MIEEYRLGLIIINGKTYVDDVEVRWTDEILPWSRKESHVIDINAVKEAVEQNPSTIIIGTGELGLAKVEEETKKYIEGKGIRLMIDKTEDAVKTFNVICDNSEEEEGEQDSVIGLFHLTS